MFDQFSPENVIKALREKVPFEQIPLEPAIPSSKEQVPILDAVRESAKKIRGTLEALMFDGKGNELAHIPVSELAEKLPKLEKVHTLILQSPSR